MVNSDLRASPFRNGDHLSTHVSVVLVTYNREKFLPRTLDCVLNQTYSDFELLICDDCSMDGTEAVCREYAKHDSRIRYYKNDVNLGMPGNLNAGIARTRFEFIANLHDGDIYHPTLLEKWRAALLSNPTAGFVFNIYRHLSPDGLSGTLTDRFPRFIQGREFLEKICFRDTELECPVWGTVMARRGVYEALGLFDPAYGFWSDFDMWLRIAERYDVAFVPEVLIELPSRTNMPHLFASTALKSHPTIFRIYWTARRRHYWKRPVRLATELATQIFYFARSRTRRVARRLWTKPNGELILLSIKSRIRAGRSSKLS